MTGASRNINNFTTNAGRKGYSFAVNGREAHFFRLRIDGRVRMIRSIRDEGLIGMTGEVGATALTQPSPLKSLRLVINPKNRKINDFAN